jgi:hypothetical protein
MNLPLKNITATRTTVQMKMIYNVRSQIILVGYLGMQKTLKQMIEMYID